MKKSLIALLTVLTLTSCTSVIQLLDEVLKTEPQTEEKENEKADDGGSGDKDATKRQRKG
ncbi:MAG: lipoprotein [Fibromonadales bacterium]|nr:lipoprotein [Fibromonadales bacterium]